VTVAAPPLVDVSDDDPTPLCFACLRPFRPGTTLCEHCGGPVSGHAMALPFEATLQEARLFGRASDLRAPTFAIVLGTWLVAVLFAAAFPLLLPVVVFGAVRTTLHWRRHRARSRQAREG
jgi:hypothetical protein